MRKFALFLIVCLNISLSIHGQHIAPSYRDADPVWLEQLLFSGFEWRPRVGPATGNEFFLSSDYVNGSVTVDGITFDGIKIRYDIFSDRIIILWKDINAIVPDSRKIDAFSVFPDAAADRDPGRSVRRFINLRDDYTGLNGFAEVIYRGSTMVVARHTKVISKHTSMSSYAQYRDYTNYWFITGKECMHIRNKPSFLRMLGDYEDEVKQYIRQNHLVVGRLSPEGYGVAAAFYDSLTSREAVD